MSRGDSRIESLSQRELRNESGRVLRAVSEGSSFILTNRGVPVGRIVPLDAPPPSLTIARPARRQ
ncbi:MAG: type II toxin-antitoxin system prevent-host-death family antitoxin, partial [Cryobacterium sp.]|nr:type II toxin-antitoxin system prevent-host-death family antitoxin [Cryobacterium sp.]